MPQLENGDIYTKSGVRIKLEDLTHQFTFFGKTFPIGKFDPLEYPVMMPKDTPIQKIGIEILHQLEESGFWTEDEMVTIASMTANDFLMCIDLLRRTWNGPEFN